MVLIIGNVIVMAMTHADMTADFEFGLFMVNTIFAAVFLLEAVLKLIALYPRQYFADAWNTFDFGVVCLSVVGGSLSTSTRPMLSQLLLLSSSSPPPPPPPPPPPLPPLSPPPLLPPSTSRVYEHSH